MLYLCIPNDGENYTLILNNDFTTYKYKSINLKTTLMKKALLSLAAVIGMGFAANADVVTVTFSDLGYANAQAVAETVVNDDITLKYSKASGSNDPAYYNTGKAMRLYAQNTMTVTAAEGFEISKIEFTVGTGSYGWNSESTVSVGTFSDDIWTGNANAITFTQGGSKGHVRMVTMTITYNSTVAAAVETPVISLVEGEWSFNAEITCATEGAEIYYTLDGTTPTTDSELYTAPIVPELAESITVKAIAVKDGMVPSAVAEQTYKLSSGIEDVVLGSDAAAEYFNLQGVRVAQPAAGLYLRRCGDKVEKVVVK